MFDFSFGELLLAAVCAVVFIGPKELPGVARAARKAFSELGALMDEIKGTFDEVIKAADPTDPDADRREDDELEAQQYYIKDLEGEFREVYDVKFLPDEKTTMPKPKNE